MQTSSMFSSSSVELMVTIVPIMNSSLMISLALRFSFSASSPTLIGP